MRLRNIDQIHKFLDKIDHCKGDVWLESVDGDKINLKSKLSQYVAIGALLSERGDSLELFCALPEDERLLLQFFNDCPETLG